MLRLRGHSNPDGSFNWRDAFIDAGIMAGLTFFTSLGGLGATGIVASREIIAAGIAAATELFIVLALKRGLKAEKKEEKSIEHDKAL